MLGKLANQAMEAGLSGMEFASGIPGTLGGAVVMNAGAYGGEMKDILISATVLDDRNEVVVLDNQALELGYRTSVVAKKHYIVLEASLQLKSGNREEILALMQDLNGRRREKQPLNYPSAGSTFKRPEGHFAGKLIEECGLRGYQVGDAMVSTKHCGFVVNAGSATAADVMQLITDVKETVYRQTGVMLEPEVKFLG
jgi:UDP-N-acetylmuramate dehydrogenase